MLLLYAMTLLLIWRIIILRRFAITFLLHFTPFLPPQIAVAFVIDMLIISPYRTSDDIFAQSTLMLFYIAAVVCLRAACSMPPKPGWRYALRAQHRRARGAYFRRRRALLYEMPFHLLRLARRHASAPRHHTPLPLPTFRRQPLSNVALPCCRRRHAAPAPPLLHTLFFFRHAIVFPLSLFFFITITP